MSGVNSYEDHIDKPQLNIEAYLPLVMKIALHIKRRLPSHIELDDLVQSGVVGLMEAGQRYDATQEVKFETFAGIRIHGAIIDQLRKNSWGTRETSRYMRMINQAISQLEQQGNINPSQENIAAEMHISVEAYQEIVVKINISHVISMENCNIETDEAFAKNEENPAQIHEEQEKKERLKQMISSLPERDQIVLSLYYIEEFSFKQIGEILNLSEARICQLHSQALAKLRSGMVEETMDAAEDDADEVALMELKAGMGIEEAT